MARAREMAQMAAAGGADAPFGVSCTPAARLCQKRQKEVGGSFRVYQKKRPRITEQPFWQKEYDDWKT